MFDLISALISFNSLSPVGWPEIIVVSFEIVQIDQDKRKVFFVFFRVAGFLHQTGVEETPVVQLGQLIDVGQP